jgi:hypothetical protein
LHERIKRGAHRPQPQLFGFPPQPQLHPAWQPLEPPQVAVPWMGWELFCCSTALAFCAPNRASTENAASTSKAATMVIFLFMLRPGVKRPISHKVKPVSHEPFLKKAQSKRRPLHRPSTNPFSKKRSRKRSRLHAASTRIKIRKIMCYGTKEVKI